MAWNAGLNSGSHKEPGLVHQDDKNEDRASVWPNLPPQSTGYSFPRQRMGWGSQSAARWYLATEFTQLGYPCGGGVMNSGQGTVCRDYTATWPRMEPLPWCRPLSYSDNFHFLRPMMPPLPPRQLYPPSPLFMGRSLPPFTPYSPLVPTGLPYSDTHTPVSLPPPLVSGPGGVPSPATPSPVGAGLKQSEGGGLTTGGQEALRSTTPVPAQEKINEKEAEERKVNMGAKEAAEQEESLSAEPEVPEKKGLFAGSAYKRRNVYKSILRHMHAHIRRSREKVISRLRAAGYNGQQIEHAFYKVGVYNDSERERNNKQRARTLVNKIIAKKNIYAFILQGTLASLINDWKRGKIGKVSGQNLDTYKDVCQAYYDETVRLLGAPAVDSVPPAAAT